MEERLARLKGLLQGLKQQQQVAVFGGAIVDVIMEVPSLPRSGDDLYGRYVGSMVGGCGFNVAVALKRLGMEIEVAIPIGQGPYATQVCQAMAQEGIVSRVAVNQGGDCGWCFTMVEPDGERTFISALGVEGSWSEEMLHSLHIHQGAYVYLSGYEVEADRRQVLLSWLEEHPDLRLVFDPGPKAVCLSPSCWERILALHPILTLNEWEALSLTHVETITEAGHKLYQWSQGPVIIHAGGEGAYLYDEAGEQIIQAFPTEVVDTVGAGDSHTGAILAGLCCGWQLEDAILLGNLVASIVVSRPGPCGAPTIAELKK
ncbi:PfkB family carbohydrate kinase [Rubeoparvulum massiliense]|uniref:PfkB family carbohydrate kinase n=1 Tax=Rubeoparvulum massiliense TaxID=1631346 RepID=UPI00065E44B2|nr:PfkB family carbohydrate kinase [Rubeoparvulum massiliense]